MKRLMMSLVMMVAIAASAAAMSLSKARKEALFLSDKMAYELSLSLSQYEAVYEINLDYMLGLNAASDLNGVYWLRRNSDLRYVLSVWQWERYCQIVDFYRPMVWVSRSNFSLSLRSRYADRSFFFYDRPAIYKSYRGGHNAGRDSYYANRDFNRPSNNSGPQRYGSSAPAPQGSSRSGNKSQPSYSFGSPSAPSNAGQGGSVRSSSSGRSGSSRSGNNGSVSRSSSSGSSRQGNSRSGR